MLADAPESVLNWDTLASALSAGLGQHQSLAPPKKMPRVAWGNAGAKHSLVVLGGWLDRAPIAYTCSLTRSLHGDAALPVLRLAERPFALSTIPTD